MDDPERDAGFGLEAVVRSAMCERQRGRRWISHSNALTTERDYQRLSGRSTDFTEGVAAFQEKPRPDLQGALTPA